MEALIFIGLTSSVFFKWDRKWKSSAHYYTHANGLAENDVKRLKGFVIKMFEDSRLMIKMY